MVQNTLKLVKKGNYSTYFLGQAGRILLHHPRLSLDASRRPSLVAAMGSPEEACGRFGLGLGPRVQGVLVVAQMRDPTVDPKMVL